MVAVGVKGRVGSRGGGKPVRQGGPGCIGNEGLAVLDDVGFALDAWPGEDDVGAPD